MHTENWLAFAVSLLAPIYIDPDRAFRRLEGREKVGKITKEDIAEMVFLKIERGYRYNELAKIYGITYRSAVDYIRRYKPPGGKP